MALHNPKLAPTVAALGITAALGACSPASQTNNVPAAKTEISNPEEHASAVAREMHNQMSQGEAMHDSMQDGTMPADHMGPDGAHGAAMKGMGSKAAPDPAPKDKPDPMPMSDM